MFDAFGQFDLLHRAWLVLPGLVFLVWLYLSRRRFFQSRPPSRSTPPIVWAIRVCRAMVAALLVLAIGGLAYRGASSRQMVVLVNDRSPSVEEASRQAAEQSMAAAELSRRGHETARRDFAADSNLEQAVLAAAASIPPDFVPRIVLLSDGLQTAGDIDRAIAGARVPISVVPLASFDEPEVCAAELIAPAMARPLEPFSVTVVAAANHDDEGRVELVRDGQIVERRHVTVTSGENFFAFRTSAAAHERTVLEAKLSGFRDKFGENNRRTAWVYASVPARVLLVGHDRAATDALADALAKEGLYITRQAPAETPDSVAGMQPFDLVILSDVSAGDFDAARLETMRRYVHDHAGGLIVIGGERVFAADVFGKTTLESMLPVETRQRPKPKGTRLAMMMMIDRSGSMAKDDKLVHAKQAAVQTVEKLAQRDEAQRDLVGVLAFSDDRQWVSDLVPCTDVENLRKKIDGLEVKPRGGTSIYPALGEAVRKLKPIDADHKHLILLTDCLLTERESTGKGLERLAKQMAADGITLFAISIGEDADQALLEELANIAGKHHHCDKPEEIPGVVVADAENVQRSIASFQPRVARQLPYLEMDGAPPLLGYEPVSLKPRAELVLAQPQGDPLLSWWRYGNGVAAAFTSQAGGGWGEKWLAWPGASKFWARVARHALRSEVPGCKLNIERSAGMVTVTLDAVTLDAAERDGKFINDGQATMAITGPRGGVQRYELPLAAPGRYRQQIELDFPAAYEISVSLDQGSERRFAETRGLVVDYPDELRLRSTNEELLHRVARLSGGVYDPAAADVFAADGRTVERVWPLWSFLVRAAMVLMVIEAALRRRHAGKKRRLAESHPSLLGRGRGRVSAMEKMTI